MCGIFALFGINEFGYLTKEEIEEAFMKGQNRGPEQHVLEYNRETENVVIGFHRLAINGFGKKTSSQPLNDKDCTLICNGEIYNWKYLCKLANIECKSGSDCEIIIHLYKKYGIEQTLQMLDGVFAFHLWDKQKNRHIIKDFKIAWYG